MDRCEIHRTILPIDGFCAACAGITPTPTRWPFVALALILAAILLWRI